MAERQYVYDVQETEAHHAKLSSIGDVINEYAEEGWRLVETLERDGTTMGMIFERELEE